MRDYEIGHGVQCALFTMGISAVVCDMMVFVSVHPTWEHGQAGGVR